MLLVSCSVYQCNALHLTSVLFEIQMPLLCVCNLLPCVVCAASSEGSPVFSNGLFPSGLPRAAPSPGMDAPRCHPPRLQIPAETQVLAPQPGSPDFDSGIQHHNSPWDQGSDTADISLDGVLNSPEPSKTPKWLSKYLDTPITAALGACCLILHCQ